MLSTLARSLLPAVAGLAVLVAPAPAQAAEYCGKWDTVDVNGKEYVIQNNIWGADTAQCIDVTGSSFRVTRSEHNNTGGMPAAYPSIFKGCHWDNCTNGSALPLRVSEISRAHTTWNVSAGVDGAYNVAYDVWFKTSPEPGAPDGTELMIWLDSEGGVQPAGSIVASNVQLAGATWNVWRAQMDWNYIAYQRTSPTSSVDFDLRPFISDAVSRGAIQSAWYLAGVEAGFEIWRSGAGLTSNSFSFSASGGGTDPPTDPSDPPTTEPPGDADCEVRYEVPNDWGTGFTGSVTIVNTGAPVDGWTLGFGFPGDQRITHGWSAVWSQSGSQVTARNLDWNARLGTGESTVIGFNADYSGSNPPPTGFTLNGTACSTA